MQVETARVVRTLDMGVGVRVALDFVDELGPTEGVCVGDTARGLLTVLSENRTTEQYPPREFRVNAGSLHQYVYLNATSLKYLSEVRAGDVLTVVSLEGHRTVAVGRVKRERRSLIRIVLDNGVSATLQAAESVHLLGSEPLCLLHVREGDEVAFLPGTTAATHLGQQVDAFVEEL